ncbi:Hepatic leukemia factor [Merluccius polli]|uniref:Hepatic leukemia factor n=1 Tax=Merluccius polli TaxID=89951 RepID=A0AA47N3M3_MERPO|nr:Hepatic leukemia factor [Merluccius polli]
MHMAVLTLSQSFLLVKQNCKSKNKKSWLRCSKTKTKMQKKIERLMVETFPSQRRDVLSALKETEEFLKEWPFLCQEAGMRLHFKELTGVQLDASFGESTATKFRRILRYFQFGKTESSSEARTILSQALAGGEETSAAVLMLVAHFKEQQDKMFINVDDTAIGVDVDTTKLPWTPCIVVCGNSPLTAKMFMVAVDQVIVNEQLPCFTKALEMMFCSYYLHNIDYPVALAATLEFLQKCIFKINPDQGTKVKRKDKGRQYAVNPRVLKEQEKEKALEEEEERNVPQSAFLGPTLWDKTLPYDGDNFQLEYMDLEEFLSENGIPSSPAHHHQHQHHHHHHHQHHDDQHQSQAPQHQQIQMSPTTPAATPSPPVMDLSNHAATITATHTCTMASPNCMHGSPRLGSVCRDVFTIPNVDVLECGN